MEQKPLRFHQEVLLLGQDVLNLMKQQTKEDYIETILLQSELLNLMGLMILFP